MSRIKDLFGDQPFTPKMAHQLSRITDPDTSYQAGAAVVPKLRELQRQVLDLLSAYPAGLTNYEIEVLLGDHGSTYRTRTAELVDLGLVRYSGQKRQFKGRMHKVWVAT